MRNVHPVLGDVTAEELFKMKGMELPGDLEPLRGKTFRAIREELMAVRTVLCGFIHELSDVEVPSCPLAEKNAACGHLGDRHDSVAMKIYRSHDALRRLGLSDDIQIFTGVAMAFAKSSTADKTAQSQLYAAGEPTEATFTMQKSLGSDVLAVRDSFIRLLDELIELPTQSSAPANSQAAPENLSR